MAICDVCKNDTERYNILINVAGLYPPRDEMDALVSVCPTCGFMKLTGADSDHMKMLATGYPEPTQEMIDQIDIDEILLEARLPNIFHGEKMYWIKPEFKNAQRETAYANDFGGGYPFMNPEYNRLVHFLLMDKAERDIQYGPLQCSAISVYELGDISFQGGYHRFCLFRFLGAKRIPVAMTDASLANAKSAGVKVYKNKTGD